MVKIEDYINDLWDVVDMEMIYNLVRKANQPEAKVMFLEYDDFTDEDKGGRDNFDEGVVIVYTGDGTKQDVKEAFLKEFNK